MYFRRDLVDSIDRLSPYPVIAILGPRQSGKTTLARHHFKNHTFVSLEDPSKREYASTDPRGFLNDIENEHGVILDEFQYVPQLLSYIQIDSDAKKRPSYFILTGSQNFLMNQAITQSLAGRVGILTLLPMSMHELTENSLLDNNVHDLLVKGSYPRLYADNIQPDDFYPYYINTYVEKDVRQIINVTDLRQFQKFLRLCASRVGQLLNMSDLAVSCEISVPTVNKWLSLLEASYILFMVSPYFNNFSKRVVKAPKIYFYDTGLACSLLGLNSPDMLALNIMRGGLFENLIMSDIYKQFYNIGKQPPVYFWRDKNGRIEIDVIIDIGTQLIPIEIKASQTISLKFFDNLISWNEISQTDQDNNYLVYAGEEQQKRTRGRIVGWQSSAQLINEILKK